MADGNSIEIFDGVIDGAALSWKVSITGPMPMTTLEFGGAIEGNRLSGTVVLGEFGNSTFSGTRSDVVTGTLGCHSADCTSDLR